jgi:putative tricarboxylic transport membrane protein
METLKDEDGAQADVAPTGRPVGAWALQGVLLLVAAYVITSSGGLGIWTPEGPGPGFFPLVLAVSLALLTIAWFVQTPKVVAKPSGDDYRQWRSAGVTLASLVVVGALLDVIGFQLGMLLLLMFHLRIRGRCGWVTSIAVSVLGSIGAFRLFNDFLSVSLPVSIIPPFTLIGM